MKLRLAVIIATFVSGIAVASDDDPWFGTDKWIHFGASATMTSAGYGVFSLALKEPWQRALGGSGLSLTIGSLKELADATSGGVGSWRDMTWNVAGTAIGAGVCVGVDYAIRALFSSKTPPLASLNIDLPIGRNSTVFASLKFILN